MCKIILGIQNEKSAEFKELIKAQYDDLKREHDGIGVLMVMNDGKLKVLRELEKYDSVLSEMEKHIDNAYMVGVHTRTATSGTKDLSNVHWFEENGVYFAHNGTVYGALTEYNGKAEDKREAKAEKKHKHNKHKHRKETSLIVPDNKIEVVKVPVLLSDIDIANAKEEIEKMEATISACLNCSGTYSYVCDKHITLGIRYNRVLEGIALAVEKGAQNPFEDTPLYGTYYWDKERQCYVNEYGQEWRGEGNPNEKKYSANMPRKLTLYNKINPHESSKWGYRSSPVWESKGEGICDSYAFLKLLVAKGKITQKSITELAEKVSFFGLGVIYDSVQGKLFLLVAKDVNSISDDEKYHAIFSYLPEKKIKEWDCRNVFGIDVYAENDRKIDRPMRKVYEGIHEVQVLELAKK